MHVDIAIQVGLGRFFGAKFRAGVLFALFSQSQIAVPVRPPSRNMKMRAPPGRDRRPGRRNLRRRFFKRYHLGTRAWADKLPAIDDDIAALKGLLPATEAGNAAALTAAIAAALARPVLAPPPMSHRPPPGFAPGVDLPLTFASLSDVAAVTLWYRHVNQAETLARVRRCIAVMGEGRGRPLFPPLTRRRRRTPCSTMSKQGKRYRALFSIRLDGRAGRTAVYCSAPPSLTRNCPLYVSPGRRAPPAADLASARRCAERPWRPATHVFQSLRVGLDANPGSRSYPIAKSSNSPDPLVPEPSKAKSQRV